MLPPRRWWGNGNNILPYCLEPGKIYVCFVHTEQGQERLFYITQVISHGINADRRPHRFAFGYFLSASCLLKCNSDPPPLFPHINVIFRATFCFRDCGCQCGAHKKPMCSSVLWQQLIILKTTLLSALKRVVGDNQEGRRRAFFSWNLKQ